MAYSRRKKVKAKPINNALYWSGTMLDQTPNLDAQLQQTATSGFTNLLLWALHVNTPRPTHKVALGDLTWNDTLLVSSYSGTAVFDPTGSFTKLGGRLNTLLSKRTIKKIFFSIGGDGTLDFTTIKQLSSTAQGQQTLQNNFAMLLKNLPIITGFDFDDEDLMDANTTAWFTSFLFTKFYRAITYCPWGDASYWDQCLQLVYKSLKKQPVAGINLQCYSGGNSNNPLDWVKTIKQNQSTNGVADPDSFMIPGYAAMNTVGDGGPPICPPAVTAKLTPCKGQVGGAFIWNSTHIFDDAAPCSGKIASVQDYANAIVKALQ
jgi:hypothetical protein